jgi:hypothetical protein
MLRIDCINVLDDRSLIYIISSSPQKGVAFSSEDRPCFAVPFAMDIWKPGRTAAGNAGAAN